MSGEETLLVANNVKHKKQEGSIAMTRTRFAWFREGSSSEMIVNVAYLSIKSHKISKEGSSSVQMQLVLNDGGTYNFHFTGEDPKKERGRVSEMLVQCISKSNAAQISNPELEAKWKLLQDADLYALYKDTVVSGIITAEEFWANHQTSSHDQQQRSGLPSAFLVDIEAVSGCNTVQYQLSTDIIENIFRTYPTVKEKHSQLVPDKLTEEQFWVQFFQSHKFHRNRLPQSSSGQSSSSSIFHECMEQDITAIRGKPAPSESIMREIDDPTEDIILEDALVKVDKQLVQRCNQHSALVLNAIQSDETAGSKNGSAESTNESSLQLAIGPSHMIADTPPTALHSLASHYLYTQESQQSRPLLLASQAQSASKHFMIGGSLVSRDTSAAVSSVSPSVFESLCRYQRSLGELLRHFWACFPVVNQQLEQKVHRMAQCLQDFKEKQLLIEFKSQLSTDTEEKLLQQLLLATDSAIDRYRDWTSKQK